MKSLLVDALRKAGGQDENSSQQRTDEETSAANVAADRAEADAGDEALLLPVLELGDDEPLSDSAEASDELALALEPDDGHDASSVEALAVEQAPLPASTVAEKTVRDAARDANWLYRAGRWSPLLYLFALSSATASYYGYQRLTLAGVSTELGSMPAQLAYTDTVDLEPGNAWVALEDSEGVSTAAEVEAVAQTVAPRPARPVGMPAERTPEPLPLAPKDPLLPLLNDAYVAYGAGDYPSAELLYRRVLEAQPFRPQALSGFAAALQRQGKLSAAREAYEQLLKVEPGNAAAAASLIALIEENHADAATAETQLKLLARQHPQVSEIRAALGRRHAQREQWPEAYEAYLRAVALRPARADYHYNAAVSAEHLGQLAAAREHYAAALQQSSESAAFDTRAVAAHLTQLGRREDVRP